MSNIPELFASMVFDDKVMKEYLPSNVYETLRKTIDEGAQLDITVATVVAEAMKNWAIEKGATHYTHWFQPLTGITAEKHDSFIKPTDEGRVIMEFSGKELIKGESDASSFPNGGIRANFEARGYTAWDPTSYAFVKGNTLYIPTAFCSYGGEALDKKTPLLRSMAAINKQSLRILKLFGRDDVKFIQTNVGPEQEYFLIDKDIYKQRKDLVFTGRTLFGAQPPKGQELDDHYYGSIKPRIAAFMEELDLELWKLGVYAKTEHNEVAPCQHELAPIYTTTNIATDHNQIVMESMRRIASRHGFVCLLHEKPFNGVNGSGKHNNWSISTDRGDNLLKPGNSPYENAQFLLFLCAVIQAVDDYQDLIRIATATASNDRRLGCNEAPPAIISMFLGDDLTEILNAIENDLPYDNKGRKEMKLGVPVLPKFLRDTTDRNRTSPVAFTGNKFEFRMLGSSNSIADINTMINTTVAECLSQYADILENAENFDEAVHKLLKETIKKHKRILFGGNGYDESWIKEAEARGLSNLKTTPDCLDRLLDEKNVSVLSKHGIFSEIELKSRYEIYLENFNKTIAIEANTMTDMVNKEILPAISKYTNELLITADNKKTFGLELLYELDTAQKLSKIETLIMMGSSNLCLAMDEAKNEPNESKRSFIIKDKVIKAMDELRQLVDEAEVLVDKNAWPYPSYSKILFGVK